MPTHPPLEEYLQTIAFLTEEGGPVIQARLAGRLKKTPAAVSEIVIRLEADGYLVRTRREITLTDAGRAIADAVIRRHRLAERLLVDVVGLSWSSAHQEAGKYEHVLSPEVEARIVALLGDPATCPHGNPIPGTPGPQPAPVLIALAAAPEGQQIRLERIPEDVEDDEETLRYLERANFLPGTLATVGVIGPEGTLSLTLGDRHLSFGVGLAGRILVSVVAPAVDPNTDPSATSARERSRSRRARAAAPRC